MNTVATEMIKYYAGDKKRINHFIKVHGYAKAIGEAEELDERTMLILETAAYVHDIGIKGPCIVGPVLGVIFLKLTDTWMAEIFIHLQVI